MIGPVDHGIWAGGGDDRVGTFRLRTGKYIATGDAPFQLFGWDFRPTFFLGKGTGFTTSEDPVLAWSGMGSSTNTFPAATVISPTTAPATGIVTGYDAGGITIGSTVLLNTTGLTYNFVAWAGGTGETYAGTYVGSSVAGRSVPTPWQPDVVIVRRRNLNTPLVCIKTSTMTGSTCALLGGATANQANSIETLTPTGFTVGSSMNVNVSPQNYDLFALRLDPSWGFVGSYTGNSVLDREIVVASGFSPEWVFRKGE